MDELRVRFAALERVPVPDLWSDIDRRVSDAAAVSPVPGRVTWRADRSPQRLSPVLIVLLLSLLLALALAFVAVGSRLPNFWTSVLPSPTPSIVPSPTQTPSPSQAPPSYPPTTNYHGWPSTSENPPGLYSWTGSGGNSTHLEGFMHNCYGPCSVDILMGVVRGEVAMPDDAREVTVVGHDAIYRRIEPGRGEWTVDAGFVSYPTDDLWEEWIVDIDGTTIYIHLRARSGASQADLAEARGIIESMRYEPRSSDPYGFRIIFTITTDDWDSG
jgi:hypothetical protein